MLILAALCAAPTSAVTSTGTIKYAGDESSNMCLTLPGSIATEGTKIWSW